jgi:hypothetical protein
MAGGVDAPYAGFVVSLRDLSHQHFCGGSLIAGNVVLTAAHCMRAVRTGSFAMARATNLNDPRSGIESPVIGALWHSGYSRADPLHRFDIGVAIILDNLTMSAPKASLVTEPSVQATLLAARVGNFATVALGWGLDEKGRSSGVLQVGGAPPPRACASLTAARDGALRDVRDGTRAAPSPQVGALPVSQRSACERRKPPPVTVTLAPQPRPAPPPGSNDSSGTSRGVTAVTVGGGQTRSAAGVPL